MRIKNHFHIKSFALSLALKPRLPTTQNSLLFASINDLSNVHWDDILSSGKNNVDVLFSSFYNKFNTIVNKHAPMKEASSRKRKVLSKPWITTGLKVSIRMKNKLYASGDEYKV